VYLSIQEAREAVITRKQAQEFLLEHGYQWEDFTAECGDRQEYLGAVILDWAGY
jgi:hypothetical protein